MCVATQSQLVANMKFPVLERRSLLQELTLRGVRITGQRKILIETIQDAARHLDAATLLTLARKRDDGINRATVYRTLELLKKLRLIDELDLMHLNGEKHFYEAKTNVDHVHLACFQCGRIEHGVTRANEGRPEPSVGSIRLQTRVNGEVRGHQAQSQVMEARHGNPETPDAIDDASCVHGRRIVEGEDRRRLVRRPGLPWPGRPRNDLDADATRALVRACRSPEPHASLDA